MSDPSLEALRFAVAIPRTAAGDILTADVAQALDAFAREAVEREWRRLQNCPKCGSSDFVRMDEGDWFFTCDECEYRE